MVGTTAEYIYDPLVHIFATWESTEGEIANENKQVITQPWLATGGIIFKYFTGTPW